MSKAGKDPAARAARERTRLYQARRDFHAGLARRRTRDNVIACVAGGLIVIGIGAVQVAYFTVGPAGTGAEPSATVAPLPTTTPTSTPSPSASGSPAPTASASPTPTASASPTPTPEP
ncbi:hypothetical protein P0L94_05110 [Microbacter sp. GSS18]|nr:hypothetical protein P0L94_05110 [Microbacter sp. GSS18]